MLTVIIDAAASLKVIVGRPCFIYIHGDRSHFLEAAKAFGGPIHVLHFRI